MEMRHFMVAAAMLTLLALPAQAQMGGRRQPNDGGKTEQKKSQEDEKAYKAALERIPEPKEKYDPWGGARPADSAKKTK
jgi:hypothetical protein